MTDAEAAWVAGLLEGEGCFNGRKGEGGPTLSRFRITVCMTDRDVLERLAETTGIGTVYKNRDAIIEDGRVRRKTMYAWHTHRMLEARDICQQIRPWMGQRRGERIDFLLDALKDAQPKRPGFCMRGHELIGDAAYRNPTNGKIFCRICLRTLARERRGVKRTRVL